MTDTERRASRALARAAPLQLLTEKNFRHVWFAGASVGTMRWLDMLAVSVYVLEITGSAFFVAVTMFLRMFPMFLFGAIGGAFAETVDRRKLLIVGQLTMTVVYAVLFWLAWTETLQLWQLGLGVFISGFFWAIELPVRRTMIAEIAGVDRIAATMGLESSTTNFTRMIGPFIGGFVFELFGLTGTLILGMGLYTLAASLLMTVKYESRAFEGKRPSILYNLREGFRFVRGHQTIMAILSVTVILNVFGFSYVAMVPVIAKGVLGLSPFPTGILMSAEGAGAFVGALLIAFFATSKHFHQIYFFGSATYLVCIALFSFSSLFWLSYPLLWLGGFGVAGFAAMQSALIILYSPPEMRNRVMGVLATCIGVGPFGILFVGALAAQTSASTAILTTSCIGFFAMAIVAITRPELRRARIPEA